MKKNNYLILNLILILFGASACDYLDIVPDNIATIDYAFRNRAQSEKFLYTCYSFRPQIGDIFNDPALNGSDETWQRYTKVACWPTFTNSYLQRGLQNSNNPYLNFWDGTMGGKDLWQGISDCNIFLSEIGQVRDITDYEKTRWIAEVKFLKAYYHFWLFRCYGPIPIVDENLSVSSSPEQVRVYRQPVDSVVSYITNLMSEAIKDLPHYSEVIEGTEAGRIDKLGALAMRAQVLVYAASPLFNGNTDYANLKDNRGIQLFPQVYDENKWTLAAEACKGAIDSCEQEGKALYDVRDPFLGNQPEPIQLQITYRQSITDKWNKELLWGSTNADWQNLARVSAPRVIRLSPTNLSCVTGEFSPTLKMVGQYYSSNGVPINEDVNWQDNGWYENRYKIREDPSSGEDEIYHVKEGEQTVYLHFNREPRFYASIAFDKGICFGCGYYDFYNDVKYCDFVNFQVSGFQAGDGYSGTGYTAKKDFHYQNSQTYNTYSREYYPFPVMRLADLYLLYAESLNESTGPGTEVFTYLDKVRARAGLKGVKDSWLNYSTNPTKPESKDGLREIIHQERTIELALEGKRFWDIRRWKKIEEFNVQPLGWNIQGETEQTFYKVTEMAEQEVKFSVKNYFWPIRESNITVNPNLIQNYGW